MTMPPSSTRSSNRPNPTHDQGFHQPRSEVARQRPEVANSPLRFAAVTRAISSADPRLIGPGDGIGLSACAMVVKGIMVLSAAREAPSKFELRSRPRPPGEAQLSREYPSVTCNMYICY